MVEPMTTDWLDVSSVTTRKAYEAAPGQITFPVPFTFASETHLSIFVDDAIKTLSTHYTTSGEGETAGGFVTFVHAMVGGESVVIELAVPYELSTHIPTSGKLDIPAINHQFSLFTMMLKQAVANLPRSIRQPAGDVADLSALPAAAARASKYLAFDANGDVVLVSSVASEVPATAFILTLLDDTSAAQARATLGITDQSAYTALSNWQFCR
jgi:hypothetical protein